MIKFLQRLVYMMKYSSLDGFIENKSLIQVSITRSFVQNFLLDFILHADDYAEKVTFNFRDSIKTFFIFCLSPPEPFI